MRLFKLILVGIVLLVLLVGGYFLFGNYSKGTRGGTIVKLSEKGIFFKTHEGQLNVGGLTGETGSPASSLWDFSVDSSNDSLIQQLEDANLNGRRVKLYYREKFYQFSWRGDTKYFVYKVEPAPR
jgi:hypothetical protein